MNQIKINIDNELYEEIKDDYTDEWIKEITEGLIEGFLSELVEIKKRSREVDEKSSLIKILDENDEIDDGFWFGTDEEKARKKMGNFKKYKKKYKEKYKDKKIQLIVKNKLEEEIIVNNL